MGYSRRNFIKDISVAGAILVSGGFNPITAARVFELRKKVRLRFIVASDGHYGQPQTPSDLFFETFVGKANQFHKKDPVDFCVVNGDIIHNEKDLLIKAKNKIDGLNMPYYVTKGNHDMVSDAYWKEVWNMPVNHFISIKNTALILATTSNEKGDYLSPDLNWMKEKLEESKEYKNVFIFIHIPQAKWTPNAIDNPSFFELLKNYTNVRAVFHGHEHDQDGIRMHNDVPFLFDAHFGGNWGTTYKGFRVVEVLKDHSIITYIMNPDNIIKEEHLKQ